MSCPLLGLVCSKHRLCLVLKMMVFFLHSPVCFKGILLGLFATIVAIDCASEKGQDYERECNERYNTGEKKNGIKRCEKGYGRGIVPQFD